MLYAWPVRGDSRRSEPRSGNGGSQPASLDGASRRETSLTVLLAALVVTLFVLSPLAATVAPTRRLLDIGLTCVVVAGLANLSHSRWLAVTIGAIVTGGLAFHWTLPRRPTAGAAQFDAAWSLAVVVVLVVVVMRQVLADGAVTAHRIRGAVAVYLLLALSWTLIYQILELGAPGAIHLSRAVASPAEQLEELLYFSLATLTTVGWGDVTAVHPMARSAAALEALIGMLYPAILLARLVSLQVSGRRD